MASIYESNNFEPFTHHHYGMPAQRHSVPPRYGPASFSYNAAPYYPTETAAPGHYHTTTHAVAPPPHYAHPAAPTAPTAAEAIPVLAERYKTKYCKNYVQYHDCPYEERCMFAHGDAELRSVDDNIRDGLVTEEAIKAFQRQWRQAMLHGSAQPYTDGGALGEETYAPYSATLQAAAPLYDELEEDDGVRSTATVPKTIYANHHSHHHHSMLPHSMDIKQFVAPHTYRHNPYGTVASSSSAEEEMYFQRQKMGSSRCSSVDNFSSVAGDEDNAWMEESPQKRPMQAYGL